MVVAPADVEDGPSLRISERTRSLGASGDEPAGVERSFGTNDQAYFVESLTSSKFVRVSKDGMNLGTSSALATVSRLTLNQTLASSVMASLLLLGCMHHNSCASVPPGPIPFVLSSSLPPPLSQPFPLPSD